MEKRATPYTLLAETLWSKWLQPIGRMVDHHGDPLGRARSYGKKSKVLRAKEQGLTGEGAWSYDEFHRWNSAEGLDLIG